MTSKTTRDEYPEFAADYVPQAPKALRFADETARRFFNDWQVACRKRVRLQARLDALTARGQTILDAEYRSVRSAMFDAGREADRQYDDWRQLASLRGLPESRAVENRQQTGR